MCVSSSYHSLVPNPCFLRNPLCVKGVHPVAPDVCVALASEMCRQLTSSLKGDVGQTPGAGHTPTWEAVAASCRLLLQHVPKCCYTSTCSNPLKQKHSAAATTARHQHTHSLHQTPLRLTGHAPTRNTPAPSNRPNDTHQTPPHAQKHTLCHYPTTAAAQLFRRRAQRYRCP